QVRWLGFASWQWTLGLALLVLGFLIAAQLQSETPRTTYTSQERQPLVQTALELQGQQDQLKQRVLDLRAQIQQLEQRSHGNQTAGQALNDELQQARRIRVAGRSVTRALRRPRSQLALAIVAVLLGVLVVIQLRAQSGGSRLDALSAQELTDVVANLNTRNELLRAEITSTEAEADQL